jgi:hypothetical protein
MTELNKLPFQFLHRAPGYGGARSFVMDERDNDLEDYLGVLSHDLYGLRDDTAVDIGALTEQVPTSIAKTALGGSTAPANTTTTLLDISMMMQPNEAGFYVSGFIGMVINGASDVTVVDYLGTVKCIAQVQGTTAVVNAPLNAFCAKDTATGLCRVRVQINTWGGVSAAINAKNSIVFQPIGKNFTLVAGASTPAWPTPS